MLNTFILHAKHGVRFKSRAVELSDFFERHAKPAGEFFPRVTVWLGYLEYTRKQRGGAFRVLGKGAAGMVVHANAEKRFVSRVFYFYQGG